MPLEPLSPDAGPDVGFASEDYRGVSTRFLEADGGYHETVLEVSPVASCSYFVVLPSALVTSTSPAYTTPKARSLDGFARAHIRVGLKPCMLHVSLLS